MKHAYQKTAYLPNRTCVRGKLKYLRLSITFSRNERKRIDYILTRQAHRPRVYDVKVHPQPPSPAKTDSDHNIVYAMVRLSGRIAPNRRIRTKKQIQPFDRQKFRSDGDCRQRVVARIISKLPDLPLQPKSISEMAESFTKVILDAVHAPHHVARTNSGGARRRKPQRPSQ